VDLDISDHMHGMERVLQKDVLAKEDSLATI